MKRFFAFFLLLAATVAPLSIIAPQPALGGGWLYVKTSAAPPFVPTDLSGLEAWYDAQYPSSITKDGSNNVSAWTDRSINAHNGTSAGANQPVYSATGVNSLPAMTQSSDQYFDISPAITLTNDGTIFQVVQLSALAARKALLGHTISGMTLPEINATGPLFDLEDAVSGGNSFNASLTTATPYIWTIKLGGNPTSATFSLNNVALSPNGSSGSGWSFIINVLGARAHNLWNFTGAYGEIIIYNRNLTGGEITQVYNYLSTKWSI